MSPLGCFNASSVEANGLEGHGSVFPKSSPARFGFKQRKACNNTGVGRLRRRCLNAQRRNASAHGPSRARVPVFECGTVWSPLAEGPFFNGPLVPRIQLAILTTSKSMSWPRLARPRGLVDSLVVSIGCQVSVGKKGRILRRELSLVVFLRHLSRGPWPVTPSA